MAAAAKVKRQNEGGKAFDDREIAAYGWNVADAIRFTLEHLRKQIVSVPLESAVNELIEAKEGVGRSERYCKDLRLRLVPILENLRTWLQPIAEPSGPVLLNPDTRCRHEGARRRAGITEWPDNAMRHSFVSYRLAATQNAPQTALKSGHDQAVLFKHYRELVRPKHAERFFSIRPAAREVAEKIVSISAA